MPQLKKKLNTFLENEYAYSNFVTEVVSTDWESTRILSSGPVTVTASTSLNGGVDTIVVDDATMAVSTSDKIPDDSEPGWILELHQPEDLSQPMTVSFRMELSEKLQA